MCLARRHVRLLRHPVQGHQNQESDQESDDKFDVDSELFAQAADMLKEAGAKRVIGEFSLLRFCVENTFKYFKFI